MKRIGIALVLGTLAGAAFPETPPAIHIEDVDRFYGLYDATGGHPTADQLQREYLDIGTEGLQQFARLRNITATRIAQTLAKRPEIYSEAKRCMATLPRVQVRLEHAFRTLRDLYPQAKLPPVTIAVGRGKPVGVGSPVTGIQIGLEALCAALVDAERPTVLEGSLMEGAAEFAAELIAGKVSSAYFPPLTTGRERTIETKFVADQDKSDLSDWVYNSTPEKPGDLGYWVGYRIVKAYYRSAPDKRRAFREILEMTDPKAFLAKSGWYPGIPLD